MFLRAENDERIMEDNQGLKVAKIKDGFINFKAWFDRMLPESLMDLRRRPSNLSPSSMRNQWEQNAEEIERYFQHLLSLNLDEFEDCEENTNDTTTVENISPMEAEMKKLANSNMVTQCHILFITLFYLIWLIDAVNR